MLSWKLEGNHNNLKNEALAQWYVVLVRSLPLVNINWVLLHRGNQQFEVHFRPYFLPLLCDEGVFSWANHAGRDQLQLHQGRSSLTQPPISLINQSQQMRTSNVHLKSRWRLQLWVNMLLHMYFCWSQHTRVCGTRRNLKICLPNGSLQWINHLISLINLNSASQWHMHTTHYQASRFSTTTP